MQRNPSHADIQIDTSFWSYFLAVDRDPIQVSVGRDGGDRFLVHGKRQEHKWDNTHAYVHSHMSVLTAAFCDCCVVSDLHDFVCGLVEVESFILSTKTPILLLLTVYLETIRPLKILGRGQKETLFSLKLYPASTILVAPASSGEPRNKQQCTYTHVL